MIVLLPLMSTPMFLLILSLLFIGSLAFAIYHFVSSAKDADSKWRHKHFSLKQKMLLLLNIVVMIVSIYLTIYGFVESNALGALGIAGWIISSVISAYVCSPLRVFIVPSGDTKQGCAYILYYPLMIIMMIVSLTLVLLTSWIFALFAILKETKVVFKIMAILVVVSVIITPISIALYKEYEIEKQFKEEQQFKEILLYKVAEAIDASKAEKINFTEEELTYCKSHNLIDPFDLPETQKILADEFCEIYNKNDFESLCKLIQFSYINGITFFDIYFTADFMNLLQSEIEENGEYYVYSTNSKSQIYIYNDYKVLINKDYIYFQQGEIRDYGNDFRKFYSSKNYDKESLVVGETVKTVEEMEKLN